MEPPSARITVHHVGEKSVAADRLLYCGRNAVKYPHLIDVKLGNRHFLVDESERDAVCEAYAADLENLEHPHWKIIKLIAKRLSEGLTIALFCHCSPKRCHCDEIRRLALNAIPPK